MLRKKNPKKTHANLIKYLVENCPASPGRNLISSCNGTVKSVSAGRVEISSWQAECNHYLRKLEQLQVECFFKTHVRCEYWRYQSYKDFKNLTQK